MKTSSKVSKKILNELKQYEPRAMHEHQLPVVWRSAHNDSVLDVDNKVYIDFTSGIFVASVGHGTVAGAVQNQASHLLHCYTFAHLPRLMLHKKVREITGFEKAFFLSSGSEANDCAVKLIRMHRKTKTIISMYLAMHGKTLCAEMLRGNDGTNTWAGTDNHTEEFYHLMNPFQGSFKDDMAVFLSKKAPKDIAGFMIESYTGWNARFYNKQYIQDLMQFAKENDIPVCFDEVQGGFGRTGKLFAYEHYDVKPDLVVVGKGLGGGLPISAVLGSAQFLDLPDDLSSTHSANPICAEAAFRSLEYIQKNDLVTLASAKGEILEKELQRLRKYKCVKEIYTKGLLAAVIFNNTTSADKVILKAMKKGLLMVRTGRESIKIGPPLTITLSALIEGLKMLEASVKEIK